MKMTLGLLSCLALLAPATALAEPPEVGETHTFFDPIYRGTVFCDTLDQIREIVNAEEPHKIYYAYMSQRNHLNEPVCLAIVPTALVHTVTPLGVMHRDGRHFNAWAVEASVGGIVAFGLYLEEFSMAVA